MNRGRSLITLGVIVVVALAVIWLLATGGSEPSSEDVVGDVRVSRGPKPPTETELADVHRASVTFEDGAFVFEATTGGEPPGSFEKETLTWRWELGQEGNVTWIVTANVDIEPTASLVATQFDYSVSTITEDLPGEISIDGSTVRVTIDKDKVRDFPDAFSWSLTTEFDGDRGRTRSAVARDRVPDRGLLDAST